MIELKVIIKTVSDLGRVLQGHVRDVREFNAALQNGSAALRGMLGVAATLFSGATVRASLRQAREEAVALAQLQQALGSQSGTETDALAGQARELERLTGVQNDTILGVQRLLLVLGATAEQTRSLTPLVLDLAASMGQDATTAARLLGAALDGQEIRLGRFNLTARTFDELVRQLNASVRGQAEAAYNAAGPLGRLEVAWRNLQAAAGRLAFSPVGEFADRLAARLSHLADRLEALAAAHPELFRNLGQLAGALAEVLAALGPLLVGLWALRGALAVLKPALDLLRSGFVALAGPLQNLTKAAGLGYAVKNQLEVAASGSLGAVTRISAAFRLLGGLGAVLSTAIGSWQLGRWFASAFEIGGKTLHEWLQVLYLKTWGQLRKLGALFTTTGAERAAKLRAIEEDTRAAVALVEAEAAERRAGPEGRITPPRPATAAPTGIADQLADLQRRAGPGLAAASLAGARAQDQLWLAEITEQYRRGLVTLTQYLARRAAIIQAGAAAEAVPLRKELELVNADLEQRTAEIARLEDQPATRENERQRLELEKERLALLEKRQALGQELRAVELKAQADVLGVQAESPLGFLGGLRAELAAFQREALYAGDTFARGLVNVVKDGAQQMSQAIGGIVTGTTRAGQAWLELGRNAIQALLQVVAQYISAKLAMAAVDTFVANKTVAENARVTISGLAAGAGKSAGEGGWAGLLIYIGVATAVMAALMALATAVTSGFAAGGYTGDGPRDEPAGLVHRGEWVMPASTVAAWGPEAMAAIQAGPPAYHAALAYNAPVNDNRIKVAIFDDRARLRDFWRSDEGRGVFVDLLRQHAHEVGLA
jgi:hypothetical protein